MVDAVAVADAVRVDGVALVGGVALAAGVDLDREGRAVEIAREREAEFLDQLEEAVDMVVGVDGGELVAARVIVEVEADVAVWRTDGLELEVGQRRQAALQVLLAAGRRVQVRQRDAGPVRVELGVAGVGRVGRVAGARDRVVQEDQAVDARGQRAQVEHRVGLDLDQGAPVHRAALPRIAHDELGDQVPVALADRLGYGRQRQRGRGAADRLFVAMRGAGVRGRWVRSILRAAGRFVAVDVEAAADELQRDVRAGRGCLGALAGLAEDLGQPFGARGAGFSARGHAARGYASRLAAALEQLAVALDRFGRRQLGVDAAGAAVGRGDDAGGRLLERDGDAGGPDRGVEPGLAEGVGLAVEQALFLVAAVFERGFARIEVVGGLVKAAQRVVGDAELARQIAQIGGCGGAAPETAGIAELVEMVDGA